MRVIFDILKVLPNRVRLRFLIILFLVLIIVRLRRSGFWVRAWLSGLRAISLAIAKEITDASLVVVASSDIIGCLVASRSALYRSIPGLCPVAWYITCAAVWEISCLIGTANVIFSWHAKEL